MRRFKILLFSFIAINKKSFRTDLADASNRNYSRTFSAGSVLGGKFAYFHRAHSKIMQDHDLPLAIEKSHTSSGLSDLVLFH